MSEMGDMFSGLLGGDRPAQQPSPIVLPDIRYQFSEQRNPGTGEVVAILLQLWLTSMPVMQIVVPFDRLSFAHFVKTAQETSNRSAGDNNDGLKAVD